MKSKKISTYEKTLEIIKSTSAMPADTALATLVECIKNGHALAAARAVQAIARLSHPTVVPGLIDIYNWLEADSRKRDQSCNTRIAIAEALGNCGLPLAIDTLRKAVRTIQIGRLGPTPEDLAIGLRATAAIALAKVDSDALYELSLLLFDEKPDTPTSPINVPFVKAPVRKAAAQAIGILGDTGGMAILAVKLKFPGNEVADVIVECLESLISVRPPYLMEIVKPYLMGDDGYISALTALSLAENLGIEVLGLLCETLESVSGDAKEAIVIAISVIRASGIRQILFEFLSHPNAFVRRGAVKGIKTYMDDAVREKLKEMRDNDPDKYVRLEAE